MEKGNYVYFHVFVKPTAANCSKLFIFAFLDCVKIKNTDIFKFWLENNRNAKAVVNWIFMKFNRSVDDECMATIKKKINNFCANANQKWNKNKRCAKKFEKKKVYDYRI